MGLRNGTIRNIGLQENRLEQLLFGANTQGYLFAQAIVAGTKPLLKLGLLKRDSCAALELGVGVLHVVWRLGVGSARDAAGAVSVSEPRAHFGSSLLVLQHEFGGLMWNLLICRAVLNCLSPRSHTDQLWTTCGGINIAWSFLLCVCTVKENSREKEKLLVAGVPQDVLAQAHSFSILSLRLCVAY